MKFLLKFLLHLLVLGYLPQMPFVSFISFCSILASKSKLWSLTENHQLQKLLVRVFLNLFFWILSSSFLNVHFTQSFLSPIFCFFVACLSIYIFLFVFLSGFFFCRCFIDSLSFFLVSSWWYEGKKIRKILNFSPLTLLQFFPIIVENIYLCS